HRGTVHAHLRRGDVTGLGAQAEHPRARAGPDRVARGAGHDVALAGGVPQAPPDAHARTSSRPTCRYTWSILQGGTTLPHLPLRTVEPAAAAAAAYHAWLEQIEERLAAPDP